MPESKTQIKTRDSLEKGDSVILYGKLEKAVRAVVRTTKTQIILDNGQKFYKHNGERVGASIYSYAHIKPATGEDMVAIEHKKHKDELVSKLKNFNDYSVLDVQTLERACEALGI